MKPGDQVVCVKSHSNGDVIKGKIYTIQDIYICKCGMVAYDVGLQRYALRTQCGCGARTEDGITWIGSRLFAPIQRDEFLSSDKIYKIEENKIDIKLPETIEL